MRCSTLPTSLLKFSKCFEDYRILGLPLIQLCFKHNIQFRYSSSSRISATKTQRKTRRITTLTSDLKDEFKFEYNPHFHNGSKDEDTHVDGLTISKNGKALFFPLERCINQDLAKCVKSDSASASVSRILSETMPVERIAILKRWENKMIQELGLQGFQTYKQEMFKTGHDFHHYVQDYISSGKQPDAIPDDLRGYWTSIKHVFPDVTDLKFFEASVQHPYLNYHGIVDCVAVLRNHLCVIDWKTSRKKKRTLNQIYDYPLQTAAYAGAINFSEGTQNQITNVAIVIAYKDGDQADVHFLNRNLTNQYWTQWLGRLQEYRESLPVST
ncbi:mitochondrial genome maintenance exonuclease 1-like isoform X2 [Anneissia japonica]|nr:mitochondrial genome maintenance exonuclease 1-like isoform X2 [Anneissia japonica]XP_033110863.1 mitochondrial genome maintenance exonuclease 1-like isoform X2 [Anneissia japonica]XP_033110864.1 mitochondrial genome maintenance exonuclease 1-like isoform X2 [Anneissia japonica]